MTERAGRHLPDLGPRGEGWFLVQVVILGAIALAGLLGPAWSGLPRGLAAIAGAVLIGAGGLLAVRGVLDLGSNLTPFPRPPRGARLVDTGAFRLVRHPIYGGLILGAFGWGLVTASPVAMIGAVVLAGFFDLKSRREEAWLTDQLDGYAAYRARTRRLLPWLY
jgi:protein-S-isoprenylcysteine O-methyltransferase Ste14